MAKKTRDTSAEAKDPALVIKTAPFGLVGLARCLAGYLYGFYTIIYVFAVATGVFVARPARLAFALIHAIIKIWMEGFIVAFGVKVKVQGLQNVDPQQPYIIVANHKSWLDPLAIMVAFKFMLNFVTIFKHSLTWIPMFGWVPVWAGYIPVKRGKTHRAENQARVDAAADAVQNGRSVLVFAEGTRTPTHRFGRFKKGAFDIALRSGAPVLPVVVSGTGQLFPRRSPFVRPGTVRVEILPPIFPQADSTRDALLDETFDCMVRRYRLDADGPCAEDDKALLEKLRPTR